MDVDNQDRSLMTSYEDRTCKAWFEYAEPGLLTNRTIRNFLSRYASEKWPDVVKLTLLYGIVTLRRSMGDVFVPLDRIRQQVSRAETAACVEEKLPPIQEKMLDLKGDVEEILEAFGEENKLLSKTSQVDSRAESRMKDAKTPDKRDQKLAGSIYPDWWGDGAEDKEPAKPKEKRKDCRHRSPPRLCYSLPPQPICRDLEDDMVQPKYYCFSTPAKTVDANDRKKTKKVFKQDVIVSEHRPEFQSVGNIAESFLGNKWTSKLCKDASMNSASEKENNQGKSKTSTVIETFEETSTTPRSTSFWVELSSVPAQRSLVKKAPQHGVVLDFGHLESPRFPSRASSFHSRLRESRKLTTTEASSDSVSVGQILSNSFCSSSSFLDSDNASFSSCTE